MSKLDELIQQFCPDGVEFKELGEVFVMRNGYTPSKRNKDFWENGTIPWFRMEDIRLNGRILSDSIQHITPQAVKGGKFIPKNSIIVATTATIGEHALLIADSSLMNQRFTSFTICELLKDKLNIKFVFYYFFKICEWCRENVNTSSFPSVDTTRLKKLKIPVPPLPVQSEIVRILDNFTLLTAELTAELSLRKKQYEYYRDSLLSFENLAKNGGGYELMSLKDVFKRIKGTPITAEKMKTIKNDNGEIRIFAGGKTVIDAFEKDIPKANITHAPSVIVQSRGVIDFIYYNKPFTFKSEMWGYTTKDNISVKFLYYFLKNNVEYFRNAATQMGSLPQISLQVTEKFQIPIPSLQAQAKIVEILDKFDTLTNSISEGLPYEIGLRTKQYEYYRDGLLNFKQKVGA